ncbi:hypothetical protein HYC85_031646 [Camellia sinensis]|uniref:U3 small nucleolar RNA-associated protein 13 C-terminal domain-containing protein n=1 Tax=Camellia sinensis TaxID=4442 RepID=A0A7J7FR25_CAMSI|nr:hypothetical protein HYC85_031646 [Camellia sinensis]
MASVSLKKNYRCVQSLQQFYSGGPFAVSSDGSFLICACNDTIKIVDSSNSSIKSTIEGDSEPITALALSPDNTFLFSASHSRQIRVWDLSSLKCLRSWKGHEGPVMGMACDASGGLLATAGADRKVLVWDIDGGFCTHFFKGHKGVVTSIMFHPDPNRLILFSGSDDATVRVWDLATKKCIATLDKHFSAVTSMAVSEDGWSLLSAGRDKAGYSPCYFKYTYNRLAKPSMYFASLEHLQWLVVNVWDLRDYGCTITVPTYEVLEAVCVIPSASPFTSCLDLYKQQHGKKSASSAIYFITIGERGIVRLWNSEGAGCLFEQKTSDVTVKTDEEDLKRGFIAAVMLPSDQGLLCVTADQQFLFYSPTVYPEGCLKLTLSKRLVGYNEEIVDMKFLGEDEQFLAVATSHTDIVLCLDTCITSSGRALIVTGSKDNSVRLWEAESAHCLGVGVGHMGAVGAVAFSKKQRNFFVSGSSDHTLKVWSLDGLSGAEQHLKAKAAVAAHDKDINSLAISPNDSLVCSGSQDRTACVWKLPDLVSVVVLRGHKRGIWSVEFAPVVQCVITASGDKTIKIWDISNGSCLKTFEGHTSSVFRASFLTRGTQFVSCGADGLVKLWTIKTDECIATYDQHEDKVWALAVGKKTEMIATGGSDAVVNLWHDSTAFDKEEDFRKEEEGVLRGQELENAVSDADYTKAIQIAFELRRPHKLFELFTELRRKREAEVQIDKALHDLGKEQFLQLLEYVREWNTKPKLCHIAQFVLFRIRAIGQLLEGLIPYCQRHFSRIDRLERSTFLLDYTLMGMSVIEPEKEGREAKDVPALQSNTKDADEELLAEIADKEEKQTDEVKERASNSSKKRKSNKSRDVAYKKVKGAAHAKVSAVSSPA